MAKSEDLSGLKTIGDWVRYSFSCMNEAKIVCGHGTDNRWDEAVSLVYQALHLPWDTNPRVWETRLTKAERKKLAKWLKKRVSSRLPLAYISGKALYAGLEFQVSEATLIPRSPIFQLIEQDFYPWIELPANAGHHRFLDLCTGSGCLAILMAAHHFDAEVVGSDISPEALEIANQNKQELGVPNVEFVQSDVFEQIEGRFDVIISNPPYVGAEEMATLPVEYQHEPVDALEAPDNGLALAKKILQQSANYLNDGGLLVLEVGNSDDALEQAFPNIPFVWVEFEQGGHGVCVFSKAELIKYFQ
ncbi:MAG: 50S ribosomal protein L3 N(5)-glutamine methyltransferase [Pseudomonadota bacterium]|nr:50S ribosomal protein L3 N(5)-glutamine methyltransferase [Pseudomonadota bacterium]